MIIVSGRTWEHRESLKALGGKWNEAGKNWQIRHAHRTDIARLRKAVGLIVVDTDEAPTSSVASEHQPTIIGKSIIYGDDPTYFNYFAPKDPRAFFGFSTLSKMVDYIERLPAHMATDLSRQGWSRDDGFTGSKDMPEALRLARCGWPEGAEAASKIIERFTLANPRVRHRRHALAGGSVNVGRMLADDPAHMRQRPRAPGRKIVTLFVEAGCAGNINPATLIKRAAIIGAIVDLMGNAGYSCSIVITDTSVMGLRTFYQLAVVIKQAGESINLSDLIFSLGHPSFLRRMSFATCSSVIECRDIWEDQGCPANAFTDGNPCRDNEFYVPVIDANGATLAEILPEVVPIDLPIRIKIDG